jgi:RNA polymerase sigma factor (sigma-70 family)
MFHYLRRLVRQQAGGEASDLQLLDRFLQSKDEAAFEVLVWRHGPMIHSLCLRMLHHAQDAEDVLQATFLTLVRKARSIHKRQWLGSWLHKVAFRIALRVRSQAARRPHSSETVEDVATVASDTDGEWAELRPILDEAIQRLPEKYRVPVVLCYLQGQTNQEAARQLGCPLGTVCTRLNRARERLRRYLTRRDMTLSAGATTALCTGQVLQAALPLPLATASVRTSLWHASGEAIPTRVAQLSEGVIQAMMWSKIQLVSSVLVTLLLTATGAGSLAQLTRANAELDQPPAKTVEAQSVTKDSPGVQLPKGALVRLGSPRSFAVATGAVPPVFTPDGRTVISVSGNGTLLFWEAESGKLIRQQPGPDTRVMALAVSPDGRILALSGSKVIHLLRFPDLQPDGKIELPKGPARSLAFSATGTLLASGDNEGAVRLWDVATRKEHKAFPNHKAPVCAVALTADGSMLVSSSEDGNLRFSKTDTGKAEVMVALKPSEVNRLAASPSGTYMASAGKFAQGGTSLRGTVQLWTAKDGRLLGRTIGEDEEITSVAFSPDGKVVAAAGAKSAMICDVGTFRFVRRFVGGDWFGAGVAFSPDGKTLASCGAGAAVRFWDVATGRARGIGFASSGGANSLAFSPDGKQLATGSIGDWAERTVQLWDAASGKPGRKFAGHDGSVLQVAFTPDGQNMVTTGGDGTVRVWDTTSGQEMDKLSFRARLVGMSADGKTLTAVSTGPQGRANQTTFLVWDMTAHKERMRRNETSTAPVLGLSADNRLYATADGTSVRLNEVTTGRLRILLKVPGDADQRALLPAVAFSADGRFLAAVSLGRADRARPDVTPQSFIHIWEISSGQEVATMSAGTVRLGAIALSDDGRFVAGSAEDDIRVWDMTSARQVHQFPAPPSRASALVLAPLNGRLASAQLDGTTLVWDLAPVLLSARLAAPKLEANQLPGLWDELKGEAAKAQKAAWALTSAGEPAVALLRQRLQPVPVEKLRQMEQYVADLNSDKFAVREKAGRELDTLGDMAETALRKALATGPSLEVRRRIEALLARITVVRSPETLRALRAIQALEWIGSVEARQVLEKMAQGAALARETLEASAALERLRRIDPAR